MAKCEKREIPQPKPPVEYVLTLSKDEVLLLKYALVKDGSSAAMSIIWVINEVLS